MRLHLLKHLVASKEGVTSIEYALFGALIAVVIVVAIGLVGTSTAALFSLVANCVSSVVSGAGSCS